MATITLYKMTQDKKIVVKTLNASNTIASLSASFKGECSMTDPSVIVAYGTDYLTANYMYISDFGRYYFIEQTVVSEQHIIHTCHVDVLMSFYDSVKESDVILKRAEQKDKYCLYLDDPYFMTRADDIVEVKHFPNEDAFTGYNYLLTVSGPRH